MEKLCVRAGWENWVKGVITHVNKQMGGTSGGQGLVEKLRGHIQRESFVEKVYRTIEFAIFVEKLCYTFWGKIV